MKYFALAPDGRIYDLCDCGDIEAAEESAADVLPDGESAVWLADAETARDWADRIAYGLRGLPVDWTTGCRERSTDQ